MKLAVDIGGTKIRAGLVSDKEVSAEAVRPTRAHLGAEHLLAALTDLVGEMMTEEVTAIAVASAGVIKDGKVVSATDLLPGWTGTDVAGELAGFGRPVTVLGDVQAHGLGEFAYGAGRGHDSCLTVAVGTGIGGAVITSGGVLAGAHGLAGHIGHVIHPKAAGLACSCGRTGHIEPLASGSGVNQRYLAATGEDIDGRELTRRAEEGDETAGEILYGSAHALGEILGNAANLLDPAIIILSGSMTRSGPKWWTQLREGYENEAMAPARATQLVSGELGDHAPLIGAAWAAERNLQDAY
ncbi:MAG: ROK family protein [Flaviflexus sp.]|nr:ROK family protein [Flaviflexus sp.]